MPRAAWLSAVSADALASPILILGAPRSGTTWLAKIIDSHPDVLYRHEPDEALPGPQPLTPDELPFLLARWAGQRGPRVVTKRPYFAKSWQPGWGRRVRGVFATVAASAARLPFDVGRRLGVPDLAVRPAPRIAFKSIAWTEGAAVFARGLPASRTFFILRHPCGQVTSVMRGNGQQRFDLKTAGTDMPFDEERAQAFASAFGIGAADFQLLPDAAKYAWSWRAFNEPAYAALAVLSNVHVLLYEALCAEPEVLSRRILDFAGLDWNRQTEGFVMRSTRHAGEPGYYSIYRNTAAAAENWRSIMPPQDQAAVRSVAAGSPLARFWPDLMNSA